MVKLSKYLVLIFVLTIGLFISGCDPETDDNEPTDPLIGVWEYQTGETSNCNDSSENGTYEDDDIALLEFKTDGTFYWRSDTYNGGDFDEYTGTYTNTNTQIFLTYDTDTEAFNYELRDNNQVFVIVELENTEDTNSPYFGCRYESFFNKG